MANVPRYEVERFQMKSSDYCLVAIVWNEGERIKNQIVRMAEWSALVDLVIVDGGSSDGSLEEEHLRNNQITALAEVGERGLGTAIRAAIDFALKEGYDGLVTVDGNGKDDLSGLSEIVGGLENGIGLMQGSRFLPGGYHERTPAERLIGIKWIVAPLISFFGRIKVTDPTNGFRGLSRSYLEDSRLRPLRDCFVGFNLQLYLVYRAGRLCHGFQEVPVGRSYPEDGSVPTKIVGWKPRFTFFKELFRVILGLDNPRA